MLTKKEIEVVKSYKYLGVTLTPTLNLLSHIRSKVSTAKFSMNTVWGQVISRQDVALEAKLKLFNTIYRAIAVYASQVWGFMQFEDLERLQRSFLKKLFSVPMNTPNYALMLETQSQSLYLHTLKLHFNYILKVLEMPASRYPKLLAIEVFKKKVFYAKEWQELSDKYSVPLNATLEPVNILSLKIFTDEILKKVEESEKNRFLELAVGSRHHVLYRQLTHDNKNYSTLKLCFSDVKLVIKARCEMLSLRYRPWQDDMENVCLLCEQEKEDTEHFIARCPILKEYRKPILGKEVLSTNETINILDNWQNWEKLVRYKRGAMTYRTFIIEEGDV